MCKALAQCHPKSMNTYLFWIYIVSKYYLQKSVSLTVQNT